MRATPGPTFVPALVGLVVGAAVLFLAETTWLNLVAALVMLGAAALTAVAIATPEFLAHDAEDEDAQDS
jgi:hypothetical protein